MEGVEVTQRHREDFSKEKDGQCTAEIMERRREMEGMKVKSYERGRQVWTWTCVRGTHGVTRLWEWNEGNTCICRREVRGREGR